MYIFMSRVSINIYMPETTITIRTGFEDGAPDTPDAPDGFPNLLHTQVNELDTDSDGDMDTIEYVYTFGDPHVSTLDGKKYTL